MTEPESTPQIIRIDLDRIAQIAGHGGKRAAWFLAFSVNSMRSPETPNHLLSQSLVPSGSFSVPIQLVPSNPSAEIMNHWKSAFVSWTGGNSLRDLLEHYCLMLDEAHDVACLVSLKKGIISNADAESRRKAVRGAIGLAPKLRLIKDFYGIAADNGWWGTALYQARNILTHNFGVVRERDVGDGGILTLKWLGVEGWARGVQSNQIKSINDLLGVVTTEEMIFEVRQVERTRSFQVGETLDLTPLEFSEIFYSVAVVSAKNFIGHLADFLRGQGIPVHEPIAPY